MTILLSGPAIAIVPNGPALSQGMRAVLTRGGQTCLLHRVASRLVQPHGRRQLNDRHVLPFVQLRQKHDLAAG